MTSMVASKIVAPLLALSILLLFAVASHGCAPNCSGEPVVPTPSYHQGHGRCPIDALKLRACANVLDGLVGATVGHGADDCCPLLQRLADVDAAVCLCTAMKANVLGIGLNLSIDIKLILNKCGKTCPSNFTC